MTKLLTQSGLLAVLLERQHSKEIELAWRRAHRKDLRAALWSTLTWPRRALIAPTLVHNPAKPLVGTVPRPESFTKPIAVPHQIHSYTELPRTTAKLPILRHAKAGAAVERTHAT
jgi:hypothetical protein